MKRHKLLSHLTVALFFVLATTTSLFTVNTMPVGAEKQPWSKTGLAKIDGSCTIADGAAYCWGENSRLGRASITSSDIPVAVDASGVLAGKTVTDISGANQHACAVANGAAYCWGSNYFGQLGNSTTTDSNIPVAVDASGVLAGKTVTDIQVGNHFSCAIAGGAAYCWGSNANGLGDGTTTSSNVPVAVSTSGVLAGKTVTAISIGEQHSTCVLASGAAYCWGKNNWGQLGNNTTTDSNVPVAVSTSGVLAGKTVTAISTGDSFSCAVASGAAYCWGLNSTSGGQLGTGVTSIETTPVAVSTSGVLAGKTVTDISGSNRTTCVVASGAAYCWGRNDYGQLGDGTASTSSNVPVAVSTSGVLAGKTVTGVSAVYDSACALASGAVYCWGNNDYGQLGNGTTTDSNIPVAVAEKWPEIIDLSPQQYGGFPGDVVRIYVKDMTTGVTLTIGGISAQLEEVSTPSNTPTGWIDAYVPQLQQAAGAVDIVVTNADGQSGTMEDGFMYVSDTDRKINNVSFENTNGKKSMLINGVYLVGAVNSYEYQEGLYGKSFVTLNGASLDFCAEPTGLSVSILEGYGIVGATDTLPCYDLIDGNSTPLINTTSAKVHLDDDFDITAQGTVSVNGSNTYTYNQQSNPQPDNPIDPTATVDNKSLEYTPNISKRPNFSGTAEPGSTVTVTVHSDPISCTATADTDGNWSCTLPSDLEVGQHTVNIHIILPGGGTQDLGPYAVTVPGAMTITNQTPLAPMTGGQRIAAAMSPLVLAIAAGGLFALGTLFHMTFSKLREARIRAQKNNYR